MKTNIYIQLYLSQFLLERKIFQTKDVEKIKTRILYSVTVYHTSHLSWYNVEKYNRAGEATDENMAHAHYTLGACGYKHTLSEYEIFIAFLLKRWLHERTPMLRYTYNVCLDKCEKDRDFCEVRTETAEHDVF